MIVGIGVDLVSVPDIEKAIERNEAFLKRGFTPAEQEAALAKSTAHGQRIRYLATRFAAKEAVFKAVASHTKAKSFDFRKVETLNREDGSPYINVTPDLAPFLAEAGISDLHISISDEDDMVIAFVVAEG